jgi:hypothetical protein
MSTSLLVCLVVFVTTVSAGSFPCRLSEVRSLVEPGAEHVKSQIVCQRLCDGINFFLVGEVDKFLETRSINVEVETTLRIPESAVDNNGNINVDVAGISVSARRNQAPVFPVAGIVGQTRQILVVRVVFKDGTKPLTPNGDDLDANKLYNYVFGDAHNLKTFMKTCSNGNLQVAPATGSNKFLSQGVITLTYHENKSVCDNPTTRATKCTWKTVGDAIQLQLNNLKDINYRHKMFVMPWEVDFDGAAAKAEVGGTTMWYRGKYAIYPVALVHEFGHNLGLMHSGKDGVEYADGTGWMGNKAQWNEVGSQMCFNAAKNWVLGWFSQWHAEFDSRDGLPYKGEFVGIDDVVKGRTTGNQKLILKITTESKKGKLEDTYLIFNARFGINGGVPSDGNRVVLVSPADYNQPAKITWVKAALLQGQEYSVSDSDIVVKVCRIQLGSSSQLSTANVLVYRKGQTDVSCLPTATKRPTTQIAPTKRPTKLPTATQISPTKRPTKRPTATKTPSGKQVSGGYGNTHTNGAIPECRGDCDRDSDCAAGLKCLQRSNGENVPGCTVPANFGPSSSNRGMDICYKPISTYIPSPSCDVCKPNKRGELSCCSPGGSWQGKCSSAGRPFTWQQGKEACRTVALKACPKCARSQGVWTCCEGSWKGQCDDIATSQKPHTWDEGKEVCDAAELEVCECGERNGVRSCCFGSTWGDACTKNVEPFTWANGLAACNGVDPAKARRAQATVANSMDENFPSSSLCPAFYNPQSNYARPTSVQLNGSDRNLGCPHVVSLFVFVLWSVF